MVCRAPLAASLASCQPLWREQATCSSGLQKRDAAVLTGGAGARGPYPPRHHCARLVQLLQPSMLDLLLKGETEAGRGARPAARTLRIVPAAPSKPARRFPAASAVGPAPGTSPLDGLPPSPRWIGFFHLSICRASGFSSRPRPPWERRAVCRSYWLSLVRRVPGATNKRRGAESRSLIGGRARVPSPQRSCCCHLSLAADWTSCASVSLVCNGGSHVIQRFPLLFVPFLSSLLSPLAVFLFLFLGQGLSVPPRLS